MRVKNKGKVWHQNTEMVNSGSLSVSPKLPADSTKLSNFHPNKKSDTIIYTNYVGQFSTLKVCIPSINSIWSTQCASRNSILKIILYFSFEMLLGD